ncbi:tripartite motif-containing protein 46-like [Manacus vitellinus]|uniref:tripartite motif-containing protein 46-like n=1 Tax=Manacus vitellinus TaxID=328815 RepID=UPI00115DC889|nr:tripartite motif-containing protein 46-like [Manacus vitellinus]
MKNMERELVCPVCKEMYKQPLALPCTHNVCHSPPAWHYTVEFRKTDAKAKGLKLWQRREEVRGTCALVEYLDTDSVYVLRVKGYNKAGFGEYSEDIYLHTPPAPVLNFFLDNRWGFNRDRLAISKDQRAVRSVPGIPMLFAAERLMTSCHLSIDLVIGDVAITQGKSYWACCVDPSSYLVKVGVGLESKLQEWFQVPQDVVSPRYDPDSGHDSGAEDTTVEAPPPYAFLTIGMGKILLSHGSALTSRDPNGCTVPLPPRIGICLDYEQGKVSFYDAVSFRELWECGVDCSGPVCPAFCFIGGGALHLQELVANKVWRTSSLEQAGEGGRTCHMHPVTHVQPVQLHGPIGSVTFQLCSRGETGRVKRQTRPVRS